MRLRRRIRPTERAYMDRRREADRARAVALRAGGRCANCGGPMMTYPPECAVCGAVLSTTPPDPELSSLYDWRCPDCGMGVTKVHVGEHGLEPCGKRPGFWTRPPRPLEPGPLEPPVPPLNRRVD